MPIVSKIITAHTSGGLRAPIAWALLDCEHTAEVELVSRRLECTDCGCTFEEDSAPRARFGVACPDCARTVFRIQFTPNPHTEEHRKTKIGDEIACERCGWYAIALDELRALDWTTISHTRWRPSGSKHGAIYVYRSEPRSPSGVELAMSIEARPEAIAIVNEHKRAPLSPTEGLRR